MVDTAVLRDQLTRLAGTVATVYTPNIFRTFLNVRPVIPAWATFGEYNTIDSFAEYKPITELDTQFALATHRRRERLFRTHWFGGAYQILYNEQLKASKDPSYDFQATDANAVVRASEDLLESVAATGAGFNGMLGILNLLDTGTITLANIVAGAYSSWVAQNGAIKATYAEVLAHVDFMHAAWRAVHGDSFAPDRWIVPDNQYAALRALRHSTTTEQVLERIRRDYPGTLIVPWSKANSAGGVNTSRGVLYNSGEDVQQMVIPQEIIWDPAYKMPNGSLSVLSRLKTGGVISNYPTGIMYIDQALPAT